MCKQKLSTFPWVYNDINNANSGPVNLSIPIDFFEGKTLQYPRSFLFSLVTLQEIVLFKFLNEFTYSGFHLEINQSIF